MEFGEFKIKESKSQRSRFINQVAAKGKKSQKPTQLIFIYLYVKLYKL